MSSVSAELPGESSLPPAGDVWSLRVFDRRECVLTFSIDGIVELGRQQVGERPPFGVVKSPEGQRIVVARIEEDDVSRKHLKLEPAGNGKVKLTNLSAKQPVAFSGGYMLRPGATCEHSTRVQFQLGARTMQLEPPAVESTGELFTLSNVTIAPGQVERLSRKFSRSVLAGLPEVEAETLLHSLQSTLEVMQLAASSAEFFPKAAETALELVALDSAQILLLKENKWKVVAFATNDPEFKEAPPAASRYVLDKVRREKRTFWQVLSPQIKETDSLAGVQNVVAAPLLSPTGEVFGALYGDRRQAFLGGARITKLEAVLAELLACSLAAGLARLETEQAALSARVRFEQFFTPELAEQLTLHPELLQGQDAEITMLFVDVQGFSRISGRIGPKRTVEWVADVMNVLSPCVLEHHGVLVDYVGDSLIAMWGAPQHVPNHAELACGAAQSMWEALPALVDRWLTVLGEPFTLTMGLNTGQARVGNIGSTHKFKYGPLGATVNLASRVQGAAKYLKSRVLLTGDTHKQLPDRYRENTRRLGRVRLVNIDGSVALFEFACSPPAKWDSLKAGYEEALDAFESGRQREASQILGSLLVEHPDDGPSLILLSRVVETLMDDKADRSTVWELPGK